MTFALWMVLAAAMLPIVAAGIGKAGAPGFDNRASPAWERTLSGWRARAMWAHRNHVEAFAPFAAAVLAAQWMGAPQGRVDALAGAFILIRIGYNVAYILDRGALRSVLFAAGFGCVVLLFLSNT